ncbi:MAG: TetR/AcrR family transcriptional regulator [Betaproteobacteria bacterium]|nr:MAG: TetR/AcrR family transcriptional regulator [Betaproteobacteria bacterium]
MAKTPRTDGPFPQDADRPSARKRIFDTASQLFYRKGIRAVGVETIAEEAKTTKMSLYRSFPSKDELVAEWLRDHDIKFWQTWDATSRRFPANPRKQLKATFTLLAKHVIDPQARGCPMANAAVELTDKDHPARKVIEAHKAKLRTRLAEMCARLGARKPRLLADQLFLLMEGAQVSTQILGVRGPARNVARAAESLIEAQVQAS